MALKVKIYGGTPMGEDLCQKCTRCRTIEGHRESDVIRICTGAKKTIEWPVAKCTLYNEKVDLSKYKDPLYLSFDKQQGKLLIEGRFFSRPKTIEEYRGESPSESKEETTVVM